MVKLYFRESSLSSADYGLDLGLNNKPKFYTNSIIKKAHSYKLKKIVDNKITFSLQVLNITDHFFNEDLMSIEFFNLLNKIKHYSHAEYAWNYYDKYEVIDYREIVLETNYPFQTIDAVLINLYHIYASRNFDTTENKIESWQELFSY